MTGHVPTFSAAFECDLTRMQTRVDAGPFRTAMLPQVACQAAFLTGEAQQHARSYLDSLVAQVNGAASLESRIGEVVDDACERKGESALEPFHIDRALRPWLVKSAAITSALMNPPRSGENAMQGPMRADACDSRNLLLTAHGSESLAHGVLCHRNGVYWFGAAELVARHLRCSNGSPLLWVGLDAMRAMSSFAGASGHSLAGGPMAVLQPAQDGLTLEVHADSASPDHPHGYRLRRAGLYRSMLHRTSHSSPSGGPLLLLDLDGAVIIKGSFESSIHSQREMVRYCFKLDGGVLLKMASLGVPRSFVIADLRNPNSFGEERCPWIGVGTIDETAIGGQPIRIYAPQGSAWTTNALLRLPALDTAIADELPCLSDAEGRSTIMSLLRPLLSSRPRMN